MKLQEIVKKLKRMGSKKNREGMARFGIVSKTVYGVTMPDLRKLGKEVGVDHKLALQLWDYGAYETRILAGLIDDPKKVTEKQMDEWVKGFDNWAICDETCMNLFKKTPFAWKKAIEWTKSKKEFVKRTGFAMMAVLAWQDKKASDKKFEKLFPVIKKNSNDDRNMVKKAVNWALRQIGKKNKKLNRKAIVVAKQIQKIDSKSARWIAADALRELQSDAVRKRLNKMGS